MVRMDSLERTCGNGQKVADKDRSTASTTLEDGNNFNVSAKDCEAWPLDRRNTNPRCAYFTLLTPDSNGNWRVVAVPLQCLNVRVQAGSGSESFTDGTFPGSKVNYHRRGKFLTNKVRRWDALPGKSVRHSSFNSDGFNVTNISDKDNGASKMPKPGKRNNAKKAKKKGKRDQKFKLDAGSADVAYVHGSATDEVGSSKNTATGTGSSSWETASTVLSPDSCSNSSEDNCGGSINSSEISKAFNTNVNKVDALEADCGDLSALKGVHDSNSSFLPEANDSLVLGSSSKADDVAISSGSSVDMRQSRKVPRNSSVFKKGSLKKFPNHSVAKNSTCWREVSGNVADKLSSGLRNMNSFDSQGVNSSKIASFARKNHNGYQVELSSKGDDKYQSSVRNHGNLKRRTSAGSKQELNCHSRSLSYVSKSTSNLCTELGTEPNNAEDKSPYIGRKNWLVGISQPLSKVNCTGIESDAEKTDSNTSGHFYQLEGHSNKVESFEQIYYPSSGSLNDRTVSRECKLISPHFEDGKQIELLEGNDVSAIEHNKHDQVSAPSMHKLIPVGINDPKIARSDLSNSWKCVAKEAVESFKLEGLGMGKDVSAIEHKKNDQNSDPSMHKLIPIGIKVSELASSVFSNSSHCVNKEAVEAFMLKNSKALHCSINLSTECFGHGSRNENDQHSEAEVPIGNDSVEIAVVEYSDKILQAVNNASKAKLASETVEKDSGYPVAEVERFLRAASPFIPISNNISRCWSCPPNEVLVAPLCRHNIPNISLGNMWQWYEKHGTFGLEVKAEDYENSKRLGIDRFTFRAYFVPYLSAVQLFCPRRSCSSVGVPLFSVLVPQPKIVGSVTEKFTDSTSTDELELVYEYFEAERPQHRRPLFEMINNLVRGDEPLEGRAFGDSSKLVSMAINDLHPRSWYSVAWYPIYRIPDEKFQSAFLTYHSLGHLVHARASSDSFAGSASIVSPVIGLQNYNTQGECWLRSRNSPEGIPNYNSCEILKERLRTLEHTASVMARAEVVKGNATSINRQPDYEFFLSRRRW